MIGKIMHCLKHAARAIGICSYCGRALCRDCVTLPPTARLVCSAECDKALGREVITIQLLLDKNAQNARASAFYCYLTAGLSAASSVAAWYLLPSPFLISFTGACALVLSIAGFWYGRVARQSNLNR